MSVQMEERASSALLELKLLTARDHLDSVCQQAAAAGWSYSHFLGYLLDGELRERRRGLGLRARRQGGPEEDDQGEQLRGRRQHRLGSSGVSVYAAADLPAQRVSDTCDQLSPPY